MRSEASGFPQTPAGFRPGVEEALGALSRDPEGLTYAVERLHQVRDLVLAAA